MARALASKLLDYELDNVFVCESVNRRIWNKCFPLFGSGQGRTTKNRVSWIVGIFGQQKLLKYLRSTVTNLHCVPTFRAFWDTVLLVQGLRASQ